MPPGSIPLRGTTTFNELIGLSRVMAEVAREVIVLAESHKVGRKDPESGTAVEPYRYPDHRYRHGGELKQQIEQQGVQVICVPELV